ncbi:MAG TPA: ATP phosphoribosyltransferase regulatory subunit, partial [Vicinamibacterales bacterium]|nr:ATP phosphoribosyltransferase regulatory subunit [Vicinamibacterales bacterium]
DVIGTTASTVEVEILGAVAEVLGRLGFADSSIRLNHRLVLSGLLNAAGVFASQHNDALVALDKLDKVGVEGVEKEFDARGIDPAATQKCLAFFSEGGGERPDDTLRRLDRALGGADTSVANLREIVSLSENTAAANRIRIDLSLARGLSYYTGAIMEIAVEGIGSLGGGGRYDNLVGMFLGKDVPACGFSLGLERILVVMGERNMFPPSVADHAVDVMVTIWSHETRADSLTLASELRRAGLRVDLYPEADKLGKQFKYASARRVPFVAIVGDDERSRGEVSIKDLRSGDQTAVKRSEAAAHVQSRLNG